MGFFDLLRGFVPNAPQQLARNPSTASANIAPFSLFDPAPYGASDVAGPVPLTDRLQAGDLLEPTPLADWRDLRIDDIRAQLLVGAASRIGPEHFALNPDNWPPPLASPSPFGPLSVRGYDAPNTGSRFAFASVPQLAMPATLPMGAPDSAASYPSYGAAAQIGNAAITPSSPTSIYGSTAGSGGQAAVGANGQDSSGEGSSLAAHAALTAGSFIPGPIGSLAALGDAGLSLKEGDWVGAGIGGIGALAGIVSDAGGVKAALEATRLAAKAATEAKGARNSFDSASAIKNYLGPAGEGRSWHHIVEQSKTDQFGPEAIHATENMVALPEEVHRAISGFYSSKREISEGQRVRDWLRGQPFEQQYQFGLEQIKKHLGE